jgi:peroxiredoxin
MPTFRAGALGEISPDIQSLLIKRITLVLSKSGIEKVFYPGFPPDQNARQVMAYLRTTA